MQVYWENIPAVNGRNNASIGWFVCIRWGSFGTKSQIIGREKLTW